FKMIRKAVVILFFVSLFWFITGFLVSWGLNIFVPGFYTKHAIGPNDFDWWNFITITLPFIIFVCLSPVMIISIFRGKFKKSN
ncbi:MAG: hypothetical protein NTV24_03360, partial [Candidatus Woesebacteria bacterium]|nr:hypothetical protein [Candidatus Woesebacteria bacterium]